MGGSAPAHTTQTTEVKLPAWVDQASQSNYQLAQNLSGRPLEQWGGQDVAGASPMTNQAYGILSRQAGSEKKWYKQARELETRAGSELDPIFAEAQKVLGKSTGAWDPSQYLNPYTDEVETRAVDNANRALTGRLNMAGDEARRAGAFGGSTAAVQQGVLGAEGARGIGDLSAELRRAGYDKATSDMLADRAGMRDTAGSMISGAATQGRGWLDAASGLTGTAEARQRSRMADVSALMGAGSQEQKQRQAVLDAQKAKFYERRDYPLEGLNMRLSALGMSPYGKTENIEKESTAEKQGMDFGTIFGGLMQFLPMMMGLSDKRAKTDIKRVGKAKSTGLPLYSYRYKGQRKDSPKVIGPMAQDVEKKYPSVVKEVGGYKVAPMGILTSA
jgi:hypothetical protein